MFGNYQIKITAPGVRISSVVTAHENLCGSPITLNFVFNESTSDLNLFMSEWTICMSGPIERKTEQFILMHKGDKVEF